jgi:hypothetical protein
MTLLSRVALTIIFACTAASFAKAQVKTSIYTDLSPRRCKTVSVDKESGASIQTCAGVAGYSLQVADADARQSITVITPAGAKHELNLWQVISSAFSSVGGKAEWRMARKNGRPVPVALIVRFNANENSEFPNRVTSYLAVAKITPDKICVTHKIPSSRTANAEARRAADSAAAAPCLQD